MSSSDDEDVKRAIALSLGKVDPIEVNGQDVVEIESDGEISAKAGKSDIKQDAEEGPTKNASAPTSLSFLGIDRKKMEEERLARKRKASPMLASEPKKANKTPPSPAPLAASIHSPMPVGPLVYPKGVVRKTWAFGHARNGTDIKLEEVLQKSSLQLAVLSSFQWETNWLFSKLDLNKTRVTLVMQAKEQATRDQYIRETAGMKNLRLCFPNMEGQINCMHSKLMLLSYPTYLRVVVPTANLVPYDWGEDGTMENSVFLIDLPRLEGGRKVEENVSY